MEVRETERGPVEYVVRMWASEWQGNTPHPQVLLSTPWGVELLSPSSVRTTPSAGTGVSSNGV